MGTEVPVVFRCEGGAVDGLGHIMRCLTLAGSFLEDGRARPVFFAYSPDNIAHLLISKQGFESKRAAGPAGNSEDLEEICNHLSSQVSRPILVVDNRNIQPAYLQHCQEFAYVMKISDDDATDWICDAIVDYNIGANEKNYRKSINRTALRLIGPEYNLLRNEFFTTQKISSRRLRVLITMGGEDPHNHTGWLLAGLGDLFENYDLTVVIGAAQQHETSVRSTIEKYCPHANLIVDAEKMAQHMANADIAFTAGGTTCYELAAMGVAQLGIIIEEHQRSFVKKLEEANCLLLAADYSMKNHASARRAFCELIDAPALRRRLIKAGKQLFTNPGAPRVVNALLDHYGNHSD